MRSTVWIVVVFIQVVFSAVHDNIIEDASVEKIEDDFKNKVQAGGPPFMPDLVRQHGYPVESHTVTTEDGYILTMHRIPYSYKTDTLKSKRPVVFLQHGLLCSSVDWVIMGPGKALAYVLSDAGYDVWMGNARGNYYSTKHQNMSVSSYKFWAFSWHEMGLYDLPAEIDYVLNTTGQQEIFYVAHSMGTTMYYVLMSMRPEYNSKIRHMVALAPVAFLRNTRSYFAEVTKFMPKGLVTELFYNRAFFPKSKYTNGPLRTLCKTGAITQGLCTNILFQIGGFNSNQINQTMLPIIFTYFPAGSSLKSWTHYGQLMKSGLFRRYDFGIVRNLMKYGNTKPPEYNFATITSSISLIVGPNDWLATPEDAGLIYKNLPNPTEFYLVPHKEFNHFDFLWAIDVKTLVNEKVLQILNKFQTQNIFDKVS